MYAWTAPPPTVTAKPLTSLPAGLRTLGLSEHSLNQKRGRQLDSFLEGPVVVENTLYLTDIPYGRIFAVDLATLAWSLVLQYDGEPNGLAWHPRDRCLIIADFKQGLLRLDPHTKKLDVVMDRFNGERLKGPNDVIVARDGSIIFTDQGMSGLQDPSGRVYRLHPPIKPPSSADDNVTSSTPCGRVDVLLRNCPSPNGLVLDSTHQATLFVAMTRDNSIWAAPLYPDGSVQRTGRFSSYYGMGGPDGMATDQRGNVLVAHSTLGTVFVHRADGSPLCRIVMPEGTPEKPETKLGKGTTNLTWGGKDQSTLYIVESESGTILTVQWHCQGVLSSTS